MADALPAPQLPGPQTAGQGDTAEPRKKRTIVFDDSAAEDDLDVPDFLK